MAEHPFSYLAYDFRSGLFLGQVPLRTVTFGDTLNGSGQLQGTIDLQDPRVQATNPIACTVPNRTFLVVDYAGTVLTGGISRPRKWVVSSSPQGTTRELGVQCDGAWSYFGQRVQATDYSAPPYSGITGASPMSYWTATPWDASLIACQILADAIGYADSASVPYGDPLGGLGILLNGQVPSGSTPAAPSTDYVAVAYPFTSMQTIETIINQLAQLGLGVGFDFGIDIAYTAGTGSTLAGTINISYPRRGRTYAENRLRVDLTTARSYEFPEDGTQTANQVYELGGNGAIVVDQNIYPLEQGYPLLERVMSRANMQSQNITSLLGQTGVSDLAIYSYAPVTPTVTLGINDPNLPVGSFTTGDDIQVWLPSTAPGSEPFDPRFPAGLEQEWRITGWKVEAKDEGDATMTLNLAQPPYLEALAPAI